MRAVGRGAGKGIAIAGCFLALTACSSDGDPISAKPEPSTTANTPSSKDTTTVAPMPKDKELARSAVLDVSDLPDDWRLDPDSELVDDPQAVDQEAIDMNRQRFSCLDGDAAMIYAPQLVNGAVKYFIGPHEAFLISEVVLATEDEVETLLTSLASEEGQACWKQIMVVPGEEEPIVTRRRDLTSRSDRMVAYRVAMPSTIGEEVFVNYRDVLFARKGRAFVAVQALDSGKPLPDELTVSMLNKVLDRLP